MGHWGPGLAEEQGMGQWDLQVQMVWVQWGQGLQKGRDNGDQVCRAKGSGVIGARGAGCGALGAMGYRGHGCSGAMGCRGTGCVEMAPMGAEGQEIGQQRPGWGYSGTVGCRGAECGAMAPMGAEGVRAVGPGVKWRREGGNGTPRGQIPPLQ